MRIKWIDSWRGLLIFLVIVGHVVGELTHFTCGASKVLFSYVYKLIYSFHMPAFFVLAGFIWTGDKYDFRQYFRKKVARLVFPYLFWGFLSAVLFSILKGPIVQLFEGGMTNRYTKDLSTSLSLSLLSILHGGGWPDGMGFRCNSVLWFLPAMFTLEMFYYLFQLKIRDSYSLMVLAFLCIPIYWYMARCGIVLRLPWGIGKCFRYLPYFAIGRIIGIRKSYSGAGNFALMGIVVFMLSLIHVLACALSPDPRISLLFFHWFLFFFFIALVGVFSSACYAKILDCGMLQSIGRGSLAIMVLHKFIVVAILNGMHLSQRMKSYNLWESSLIAIIASIAVTMLAFIAYLFLKRKAPCLIGLRSNTK